MPQGNKGTNAVTSLSSCCREGGSLCPSPKPPLPYCPGLQIASLCGTLLWWSPPLDLLVWAFPHHPPGLRIPELTHPTQAPSPSDPFAPPLSLLHLHGQGPRKGHIPLLFPLQSLWASSPPTRPLQPQPDAADPAKHPRSHAHPAAVLLACAPLCHPI